MTNAFADAGGLASSSVYDDTLTQQTDDEQQQQLAAATRLTVSGGFLPDFMGVPPAPANASATARADQTPAVQEQLYTPPDTATAIASGYQTNPQGQPIPTAEQQFTAEQAAVPGGLSGSALGAEMRGGQLGNIVPGVIPDNSQGPAMLGRIGSNVLGDVGAPNAIRAPVEAGLNMLPFAAFGGGLGSVPALFSAGVGSYEAPQTAQALNLPGANTQLPIVGNPYALAGMIGGGFAPAGIGGLGPDFARLATDQTGQMSLNEALTPRPPEETSSTLPPLTHTPADTYRRPLSDFTPTLYHDGTLEDALRSLPGSGWQQAHGDMWTSNVPDLATGQRGASGVMIEFDSKGATGQLQLGKPSAPFTYDQGMAEFYSRLPGDEPKGENIRSITIRADAQATRPERQVFQRYVKENGWSSGRNADGSTTYRPPATEAAPNLPDTAPAVNRQLPFNAAGDFARLATDETGAISRPAPAVSPNFADRIEFAGLPAQLPDRLSVADMRLYLKAADWDAPKQAQSGQAATRSLADMTQSQIVERYRGLKAAVEGNGPAAVNVSNAARVGYYEGMEQNAGPQANRPQQQAAGEQMAREQNQPVPPETPADTWPPGDHEGNTFLPTGETQDEAAQRMFGANYADLGRPGQLAVAMQGRGEVGIGGQVSGGVGNEATGGRSWMDLRPEGAARGGDRLPPTGSTGTAPNAPLPDGSRIDPSVWRTALDLINAPNRILTGWHLPFFRQGLGYSVGQFLGYGTGGHPATVIESVGNVVKALRDPAAASEIRAGMRAMPGVGIDTGPAGLTAADYLAHSTNERLNPTAVTALMNKIPLLQRVQEAGRLGLESLRTIGYSAAFQDLQRASINDPKVYKDTWDSISHATGHGFSGQSTPGIQNAAFLSPSYMAAQIKALADPFTKSGGLIGAGGRPEAIRSLVGLAGVGLLVNEVGSLSGAKAFIGTQQRDLTNHFGVNSAVGKVVSVGPDGAKTTIDPWAGYQAMAKLMGNAYLDIKANSRAALEQHVGDYFRGRLGVTTDIGVDLLLGQDWKGTPFTVAELRDPKILNRMAPIGAAAIWAAAGGHFAPNAVLPSFSSPERGLLAVPSLGAMSVSTTPGPVGKGLPPGSHPLPPLPKTGGANSHPLPPLPRTGTASNTGGGISHPLPPLPKTGGANPSHPLPPLSRTRQLVAP